MTRPRTFFACSGCRQQVAQWVGRCPGCGAWGTIEGSVGERLGSASPVQTLGGPAGTAPRVPTPGGPSGPEPRVPTGIPGLDRVLGGGLVPASVVLLAGEPGIGKSTLLLHLLGHLSSAEHPTLLVRGEEA